MKICFCSTFLEDQEYVINHSKIAPNISTHNFNLNILEGMKKNVGEDLTIFNTENVASYPRYKRIKLKTLKSNKKLIGNYINIGKINLIGLKDITETIILYKKLKKWIKEQGKEDIYICAYGRRLSHVIVINMLKKKYNHIKTCMILADLSGKAACKTTKSNLIKDKIMDKLLEFQVNQSKKFDSFILLTKEMAKYLGIENKVFEVIEGIAPNEFSKNIRVSERKIIAYTGILSRQYGVDKLLSAFQSIKDKEYELWIFGDGELNEEIKKVSLKDSRVKFFGFIPSNHLKIKLLESRVLINPRQNTEEYTKYSFPSKTIEYLSLGKPLIGYELDGIPKEYRNYIFYVKDNSIESLKEKIIEVCEKNVNDLKEIGIRNIQFLEKNKTNVIQTKKIIKMFERLKG